MNDADKEMFTTYLGSECSPSIGFAADENAAVVNGNCSHGDDVQRALRLVACWNACRGIDPATVPALLASCRWLLAYVRRYADPVRMPPEDAREYEAALRAVTAADLRGRRELIE